MFGKTDKWKKVHEGDGKDAEKASTASGLLTDFRAYSEQDMTSEVPNKYAMESVQKITFEEFLTQQGNEKLNAAIEEFLSGHLKGSNILMLINDSNQLLLNNMLQVDSEINSINPSILRGYLFQLAYATLADSTEKMESHYEESIRNVQGDRDGLKSAVDRLNNEMQHKSKEFANLSEKYNILSEEFNKQSESLAQCEKENQLNSTRVPLEKYNSLELKYEQVKNNISPQKYSELKELYKDVLNKLNSQEETVSKAEYDELKSLYEKLQEATSDDYIDKLIGDLDAKDKETLSLKNDILSLKSDLLKAQRKLRAIVPRDTIVNGLNGHITQLTDKIKEDTDDILELTSTISQLEEQLLQAKTDLKVKSALEDADQIRNGKTAVMIDEITYSQEEVAVLMHAAQQLLVLLNGKHKNLSNKNPEFLELLRNNLESFPTKISTNADIQQLMETINILITNI